MLTVAIFLGWVVIMGLTLVKGWQGHLFKAYSPSQPMIDMQRAKAAELESTNGSASSV